ADVARRVLGCVSWIRGLGSCHLHVGPAWLFRLSPLSPAFNATLRFPRESRFSALGRRNVASHRDPL
ncbi:hypothetical protein GW17_00058965, partial [Ensete ventricosum]